MPKPELIRLSRAAAIRVVLSVALVLGVTSLLLWKTVWTGAEPEKAEPFYTELPAVDLTGLTSEKRAAFAAAAQSAALPLRLSDDRGQLS